MGTYLSTNLWLKINISKQSVRDKGFDESSLIDFLNSEMDFEPDIYEREENEDNFVFRLKPALLAQELLPFLEAYYAVYYSNPQRNFSTELLNHLKSISPDEQIEYLNQGNADPIYLESDWYDVGSYGNFLEVKVEYWRLTFEGKVMAEEMGAHLGLFSYSLKHAFADFKIAKALDVSLLG